MNQTIIMLCLFDCDQL